MGALSQYIHTDADHLTRWLLVFAILSLRYVLMAGGAYLLFYVYKRRAWLHRKIQQKFPDKQHLKYEVMHSFLTFAVFGFMVILGNLMRGQGWVAEYGNFTDRPLWYFIGSTVFLLLFHDTYFYWIHRAMHHRKVYMLVHRVHHNSNNPSPLAAFSFHPIEAVLEFSFIPLIHLFVPLHGASFLVLSIAMILFNIMGHLGYETLPTWFVRHWFFKWINTSTNHNMHHKYVSCNYGLYLNVWDRLMGTHHKKYELIFEAVAGRPAPSIQQQESTAEEPMPKQLA